MVETYEIELYYEPIAVEAEVIAGEDSSYDYCGSPATVNVLSVYSLKYRTFFSEKKLWRNSVKIEELIRELI